MHLRQAHVQIGSPQRATEPPTRHVGRHGSPTRATACIYSTRPYNMRTYSARMVAGPSAALPAGAADPRARRRRARPPLPLLLRKPRRHAPSRGRTRASSHPRGGASTSASTPPPTRSAAAEPPTARAVRLRPAGTCDAPRIEAGLDIDRPRRPADTRTPWAVRIGEVTCGGGAAAGKAGARRSRLDLQATASARIFAQYKAAARRRWRATGGRRAQPRAAKARQQTDRGRVARGEEAAAAGGAREELAEHHRIEVDAEARGWGLDDKSRRVANPWYRHGCYPASNLPCCNL